MVSFAVVLFILVLQFLSRYMEDLFGKGLSWIVIFKVFFYASASLIVLALPLSILLSSLMTMGNLGENYELAAIKSSGISLVRTVAPMFYVTMLVTIASLLLSFYVIPRSNLKLYSLLYDVQQVKPAMVLRPGNFYKGIDGYVIRISDKDVEREMLYNIMVFDHTNPARNGREVYADSGKMEISPDKIFMRMMLFHGVSHEELDEEPGKPETHRYVRYAFDTLLYRFDLAGFGLEKTEERRFAKHQLMLNLPELTYAIDSLSTRQEETLSKMTEYMEPYIRVDSTVTYTEVNPDRSITSGGAVASFPEDRRREVMNRAVNNARAIQNYSQFLDQKLENEASDLRDHRIELQLKFALPVSCLIFLLIGAPLGAIIRKGGIGMPVIVSVCFFILFYVLMIQGKKFAKTDVLPVFVGVWLPVLVLSPIAAFLTWQSTSDSRLLDGTSWGMFLKKTLILIGINAEKNMGLRDPGTNIIEEYNDFHAPAHEQEKIEQKKRYKEWRREQRRLRKRQKKG